MYGKHTPSKAGLTSSEIFKVTSVSFLRVFSAQIILYTFEIPEQNGDREQIYRYTDTDIANIEIYNYI